MTGLTNEDLAYMRGVQQEFRTVSANLFRRTIVPDAFGGEAGTWDSPEPITVRLDEPGDKVPADLAQRWGVADLVKVTTDLVEVGTGDLIVLGPTEAYVVRTSGTPDRWVTAQMVYASRSPVPANLPA